MFPEGWLWGPCPAGRALVPEIKTVITSPSGEGGRAMWFLSAAGEGREGWVYLCSQDARELVNWILSLSPVTLWASSSSL